MVHKNNLFSYLDSEKQSENMVWLFLLYLLH